MHAIDVRYTNPYSNEISTKDTIVRMGEIVRQQANSSILYEVVKRLQLDGMTPEDQCHAVWRFVKDTLTFREDEITLSEDGLPINSELLRTPEYLLTVCPVGDCDDYSLLAATLLYIGTNQLVAFCTIKMVDDRPDDWSHVYVAAKSNPWGRWFHMDCSHGPNVGWQLPDYLVRERKYWEIR